jgi:hypothetical protein
VQVADGGILICDQFIPKCKWSCGSVEFCSPFKIIPLTGYDGIIGMDWLSSHSPQVIDLQHKWLAFQHKGAWTCLQGHIPSDLSYNLIEVQLLQSGVVTDTPLPSEVQDLLALFAKLFAPPEGLPPKRAVTHSIPLLEGARPVHTRPY